MKLTPAYLVVENSINWHPLVIEGATGKAWIKVFARDPHTDATAALVKYEKGFKAPKSTSKAHSDTIYISGKLKDGDLNCHKATYLYRPAGNAVGPIVAEEETVKFIITGDRGGPGSKTPVFVQDCDKAATEESYMGNDWSIKKLRFDEEADCVLLYQICHGTGIVDSGWTWVHPHLEEAYYIEHGKEATLDWLGEIGGHVRYDAPCYLYRPPGSRHGDAHFAPCKLFVKYYSTDYPKDIFDRRRMINETPKGYLNE
jgi:hypothetical protein